MSKIKSIMFVCMGNICRSPLAEVIAKSKLKDFNLNLKISSSGTSSYHTGDGACELSLRVASEHGLDLSNHRAKQITEDDIAKYDLFIALDHFNYRDLKRKGIDNLKLLGDFGFNGDDVPDPYFVGKIDIVYNMIEKGIENLFIQISEGITDF